MKRNVTITGRLACILIALAFAWSCSEQSDTAGKPQVVRKKISTAAKSASPTRKGPSTPASGKTSAPTPRSDIARVKPAARGPAAKPASAGTLGELSQQGLRPKSDLDRQAVPSRAPDAVAQKPAPPPVKPGEPAAPPTAGSAENVLRPQSAPSEGKPGAVPAAGQKEPQMKPAANDKPTADKKGTPPIYNPEGKTDPFKPLFEEKPELPQKQSRPKRIPRTPLERVALSQLTLTAVILAPSGNRALVQEASGKGYVIQNGTYIGLNEGKVVEIQKDRVIIEEEVEDILGKLTKRKQELKLPKPAGDQ